MTTDEAKHGLLVMLIVLGLLWLTKVLGLQAWG